MQHINTRKLISIDFGGQTAGISMLETVVYIGILSVFTVVIVAILASIVHTYNRVRVQREVVSNGRLVMETMTQAIASAQTIYAPTSSFGTGFGQLSVVTAVGAQPGETTTRIDFWLDGGRVWMRKEGSATTSITSPSARVNQLRFDQISQGMNREAVRITAQITGMAASPFVASSTLYATAALRGAY